MFFILSQTSTFRSGEADIVLLQGNHLMLKAGGTVLVSIRCTGVHVYLVLHLYLHTCAWAFPCHRSINNLSTCGLANS